MIELKLHEVMGRKRLKISDVVSTAGLARNTVADLYNGKSKRIDLDTLDKLCIALQCEITDIIEHKKDAAGTS
ncbi:helix-turn-helix domain-containing protein [Paenibacillus xanthanilyticus]|uniref:Helix-turn-helix domain-containing protein n=1 Tax=Paenibacillus xanthanilyticus TaxID=1783531 RepID=A0ABV8KA88_9BACL